MPDDDRFRYEALADFIAGLVRDGTLAPGARAPSLRELSRQHRTSLTTALQAYRLLEDRGVLQARPQSGFYVAAASSLPVPATARPRAAPTDVHFGGERPRPFGALDGHGNTIYCGSFSKTLAPGYRIGWVASRRHGPRLLEAKFAATLSAPVLPQLALAEFLASGGYDHHLRRLRRILADTLRRMLEVIAQAFPPGTRVTQPAGGFVLWLELPRPADSRTLFAQALEQGICFAPGVVFSASGRHAHCLRLSGGYGWDDRLEAGLRALGALAACSTSQARNAATAGRSSPSRPGVTR